jgi:hypothetical protein
VPTKGQCTSGQYKYLAIHVREAARQCARDLIQTPAFVDAQRKRKKVEALLAELKNQIGLRRLRLRRMKFVRETVLPRGDCPEHQATGPLPQSPDTTRTASHRLAEVKVAKSQQR